MYRYFRILLALFVVLQTTVKIMWKQCWWYLELLRYHYSRTTTKYSTPNELTWLQSSEMHDKASSNLFTHTVYILNRTVNSYHLLSALLLLAFEPLDRKVCTINSISVQTSQEEIKRIVIKLRSSKGLTLLIYV